MLPIPVPGPNDVLIAVHTAGIGVWDKWVRDGSWKPAGEPRFPYVLGTDGAGVVASRGSRVRRFRVGERVYGCKIEGGFYAEFVAVNSQAVARVPEHLDSLSAGAAPVAGLTALAGLEALRLERRETVLIFGASGAVGTVAVQLAKLRGARVLATASGRRAQDLVRDLGADEVFDARREADIGQLATLAPSGIDAALVLAGGDALERCLERVRSGGRVAYPNGVEPAPLERPGVRAIAFDGMPGPRQYARLERAAEEARLRVPVAAAYRLEDAAKAHQHLEDRQVLGRFVLQVR